MQVWAYEAISKIGERFGQRIGERIPRLLRWSTRKLLQHRTYDLYVYATLRPIDTEAEQPYFSTLVSYDDPLVPVLDDMTKTVHVLQFHSSHTGNGVGGQSGRQDLDDGVHSGESGDCETSEDDDNDGQLGSDRDSDDSDDI
ncbi:Hypothetical predicted protein, partial [Olea europaea subsp. europaea]